MDSSDDTLPAATPTPTPAPTSRPGASAPDHSTLLPVDPQHYVLGEEFARGGMGRIRRARDRRLGREVAVKELLHPAPELRERFEREARITACLEHPSIVSIHEAGQLDGRPFYAMKLVRGRSLDRVIAGASTTAARLGLLPSIIAVSEALAYAHSRRVIHRDLKPGNVLVGEFGEAVVIDWGLAKDLGATGHADDESTGPYRAGAHETMLGEVMGTPVYMPPEQAQGLPVDERADVYALGAMLYHALGGRPPYTGKDALDVVERVKAGPPPALATVAPDVPRDLIAIVARAMARDAAERYPSAREMAADLRKFESGQLVGAQHYGAWDLLRRWVRRHRTVLATSAVALLALVVLGIIGLTRIQLERDIARRERDRASHERDSASVERDRAHRTSIALLEEQGRRELLADAPTRALAFLGDAYARATPAPPPSLRFLMAEALRATDVRIVELRGHTGAITSVAFSPGGARVVTTSDDHTARLWDSFRGTPLASFTGHPGRVTSASFSLDGERVASTGWGGSARLWDVSGKELAAFDRAVPITAQLFTPAGLLIAGQDGVVELRDASTGALQRVLLQSPSPIIAVELDLAQPATVLVASAAGQLVLLDAATLKPRRTITATGPLASAVILPGSTVVTLGTTGGLHAFDERGALLVSRQLGGRYQALRSNDVELTALGDGGVRVFRLERGADDWVFDPVVTVSGLPTLRSVAMAPLFMVGTSGGKRARLWDRDGRALPELEGHEDAIGFVGVSPDGQRVATGADDGVARIWRLGARERKSYAATRPPASARTLVSNGDQLELRDTASDQLLRSFPTGPLPILGQALSPDGSQVAIGGADRSVRVLASATGALLATLDGHIDSVTGVAFSPDGKQLVSTSLDGTAVLWNLPEARRVTVMEGHQGPVQCAAFSPDGQFIATGGSDRTVHIWDLGGRLLAVIAGHKSWINGVWFAPSGELLVARTDGAGDQGWDVHLERRPTRELEALVRERAPWSVSEGQLQPRAASPR